MSQNFFFSSKKVVVQSQSQRSQTQRQSCALFLAFSFYTIALVFFFFRWCHINMFHKLCLSRISSFPPQKRNKHYTPRHFVRKKWESHQHSRRRSQRDMTICGEGSNILLYLYITLPCRVAALSAAFRTARTFSLHEKISLPLMYLSLPSPATHCSPFPPPLFSARLFFLVCFVNSPKRKQSRRTRWFLYFSPCRRVVVVCVVMPDTRGWYLLGRFFSSFSSCDIYNIRENIF